MRLRPLWTRWRAFLDRPPANRPRSHRQWTTAAAILPGQQRYGQSCTGKWAPQNGDGIDVEPKNSVNLSARPEPPSTSSAPKPGRSRLSIPSAVPRAATPLSASRLARDSKAGACAQRSAGARDIGIGAGRVMTSRPTALPPDLTTVRWRWRVSVIGHPLAGLRSARDPAPETPMAA